MASFTVAPNHASEVRPGWFHERLSRTVHPDVTAPNVIFHKEVEVLQHFYYGMYPVREAAKRITEPISTTPYPWQLNVSSAESATLSDLWELLVDALMEWPSSRTPQLVNLLAAISQICDLIHQGQALDHKSKPFSWKALPYFHMVWAETFWETPLFIEERVTNFSDRVAERDAYIKQQDVDAQLVAAGIFRWMRAPQYLISTLEAKKRMGNSSADPSHPKPVLDFQIPAVACWLKYNGPKLYHDLASGQLSDWNTPPQEIQFAQPIDRWEFWKDELHKLKSYEKDDVVCDAAVQALQIITQIEMGPTKYKEDDGDEEWIEPQGLYSSPPHYSPTSPSTLSPTSSSDSSVTSTL